MERRILTPEEWKMVAPVVTRTFGNSMPKTPAQGNFLAAMDGRALAGFVQFETLFHFNCVWVAEEYRKVGAGVALSLMADAANRVPAGYSAILLDDGKAGRVAEALGGRKVGEYTVIRRDY
jgi:ribosomal protein S18 acetylase RimI-like enzyme